MGLSSSVGNDSSFLNGIQAKRVSFNDPFAEISGPQSAKPGLFFLRTRLLFTGVVAGTDGYSLRRWNSGGEGLPGIVDPSTFLLSKLLTTRLFCGAGDVEPIARRWEKRPTRCDPKCGQRVGPQVVWLESDRLCTENAQETDFGYSVSEKISCMMLLSKMFSTVP